MSRPRRVPCPGLGSSARPDSRPPSRPVAPLPDVLSTFTPDRMPAIVPPPVRHGSWGRLQYPHGRSGQDFRLEPGAYRVRFCGPDFGGQCVLRRPVSVCREVAADDIRPRRRRRFARSVQPQGGFDARLARKTRSATHLVPKAFHCIACLHVEMGHTGPMCLRRDPEETRSGSEDLVSPFRRGDRYVASRSRS